MPFVRSAIPSGILRLVLIVVLIAMIPASTLAVDLMLGWTRSDVGLDGNDEGIAVSVAHYMPLGSNEAFDMTVELAYVQRAGSQPAFFYSETLGVYRGEGKVTLHVVQPGVTVGYSLETGSWTWRLYAGGAFGLKVAESWELDEGDWTDPYGYEDLDYVGMLGLSARIGRMVLDFRYCAGLTEQLILRNELDYATNKVGEDLFPGVDDPEGGAKLSNIQLGVGMSF